MIPAYAAPLRTPEREDAVSFSRGELPAQPLAGGGELPRRLSERRWWAQPRDPRESRELRPVANMPVFKPEPEPEPKIEPEPEPAAAAAKPARPLPDEIERVKERITKEARKEIESRHRETLTDFLDVLDDMDRALAAARKAAEAPALVEGVELVHKRFVSVLGRHGVTQMPAIGQAFDPSSHDAVATVPVSDPGQDGMVVDVVRQGYAIGKDVLRPASVVVGKYAASGS